MADTVGIVFLTPSFATARTPSRNPTTWTANALITQDSKLPPELDFFKYAQGGPAKRKAGNTDPTSSNAPPEPDARSKRRKVDDEP